MRVKFLQDFQGVETGEVFYLRGQVVNLPDTQAERLLRDERVALVPVEVMPAPAVEAAPGPETDPVLEETKSPEAPKARRRKS